MSERRSGGVRSKIDTRGMKGRWWTRLRSVAPSFRSLGEHLLVPNFAIRLSPDERWRLEPLSPRVIVLS